MEAEHTPYNDDLSTSTTTQNILNSAELTFRNENPENNIKKYRGDDISVISNHRVKHEIDNSEESDYHNDQSESDNQQQTSKYRKKYCNSAFENPSYVSENLGNIYCDSEIDTSNEIHGYNPLNKAKSEKAINLNENADSNTFDVSENVVNQSNLEIVNKKDEIKTLSGIFVNINDNNRYKTNSIDENDYPNCESSSKSIGYKTEELHTSDQVIAPNASTNGESRLTSRHTSFRRASKAICVPKKKLSLPKSIVEGVDEEQLWTEAKSLNRSALLVLWWALMGLVMYCLSFYDLWSDSSVAYLYYKNGDYMWCTISVLILLNSYCLQCIFSFYEVTHSSPEQFGRLSTKQYAIPLFFLMPWIIVFIGIYDTYKNQYTRRLETAYIMMFIEVIFESLAQTALQLNAICVYAHKEDKEVTNLQLVSVSSSVLFLSIGIAYSVIFYNNKDTKQWIKFLFCVFGGITVVSRLLLCSSWALESIFLWGVPFLSGWLITTLTWLVLRNFSYFGCKEFLTKYDIYNLPMALTVSCTWLTSFIFNCFSPSGIPAAVLMCVLAGVDFFMKPEKSTDFETTLSVINICLTSFVLICNIVFSCIPKCHIISKTWVEGEGEDDDDPYHFVFF